VHNARVLHGEISYALRQLLPAGSVTVFHLMFPDPWPKRRHALRRIVSQEFLTLLGRALAPDGMVWIATDESEYFREIERLALQSPQFVAIPEQEPQGAVSTFEKRFRQDGLKIHRLVLRKVSDETKVVASQ
jgi:tRNA (guanine-N7-)-methyltransferase